MNQAEIIEAISIKIDNTHTVDILNNSASSADEITKYKELMDTGVITQEEFDIKKKQLLGL